MSALKYYYLENATDTKIIGQSYPQCNGVLRGYDNSMDNKRSLYYFAHQKGYVVEESPDLDSITLAQSTKLTDFISCSLGPGNDRVVSDKVMDVLSLFDVGDFQKFTCKLNKKAGVWNYNWLHFVYSLERKVDYKKSLFSHPNSELAKKSQYDQVI